MATRCIAMILAIALTASVLRAAAPTTGPVKPAPSSVENQLVRRDTPPANAGKSPSTNPATGVRDFSKLNPGSGLDLQRVTLSLALVLGIILIARFAIKKMFPAVSVGRNSQVIRVVSRSVVGPKQQFLLVQLGKRLVLVGDSGVSMSSLAEVTDADEVAELIGKLQSEASTSSMAGFAGLFRKANVEFTPADDRALAKEPVRLADDEEDLDESKPAEPAAPPDRQLVAAAAEINGLMDRVRLMARRIKSD